MTKNLLQENIVRVLGIDTLSVNEQAAFLSEVGDLIFEKALLRLTAQLNEYQQRSLEQYLEAEPEPEVLIAYLLEHYKDFEPVLEEVAVEFKEDAMKALNDTQADIAIIEADDSK